MPHVYDVVPLLDVDSVVQVLNARFQVAGDGALFCRRVAPTQGVLSCTYEQWYRPYSQIVRCLSLVGACNAFYSLGWVVLVCLLLLVVWLAMVLVMLPGFRGFVCATAVVLLGLRRISCLSVLHLLLDVVC